MGHGEQPNTWLQFLQQHDLEQRPVYALGFNPHWRKTLARFTQGSKLQHIRSTASVPPGSLVLVWGYLYRWGYLPLFREFSWVMGVIKESLRLKINLG